MTGWLAILAFAAALFAIVAGLVRPAALSFAAPVLCPRDGQVVKPGSGDDLDIMRKSAGSSYAVFCTGESSGVQDVTERWILLSGALAVVGGLALLVRAKVTPPVLRGPMVPIGG